jgi:hypothetical protein
MLQLAGTKRETVILKNYDALLNTIVYFCDRWHVEMPNVVEGSILIMSKAGAGTAMFSMGWRFTFIDIYIFFFFFFVIFIYLPVFLQQRSVNACTY